MARILLVEDNEMNRDMLNRRLVRKGFEVLMAVDGEEALKMASEYLPDLILMDIGLPKMNGLEATRHLKSNDNTASIPIIALTAHATSDDRIKSFDAGCDDFDTKPVRFKILLEKMEQFL